MDEDVCASSADSAELKRPRNGKQPREFNFRKFPKRRIAILFLYYGWEFDGLVCQESTLNTVEEHLSKALLKTKLIESWKTCQYSRSGRTDKDVSAFRQVASLIVRSTAPDGEFVFWSADADEERISSSNSELNYVKILNATLPKAVRLLAWAPVPQDFNARFHCNQRVYKYGFPLGDYDVEAIKDACNRLVGEHDFRNFCHIDSNASRLEMSYVRTIYFAGVAIVADDDSEKKTALDRTVSSFKFAELTIKASGFLWHQIRCIVSLLHEVGKRREIPEIITELLDIEKFPRRPAYGLAAGTPLYLFDCSYNGFDLKWIWDIVSLRAVRANLLNLYANYRTRCLMLKDMAEEIGVLVPELDSDFEGFGSFISSSSDSTRSYLPLRKRKMCDSLEEKREKAQAKRKANADDPALVG